ncbi:MAG: hypothetical protein E7520_01305 [Ruminococcaceae bacterium]|nr:hypothetical protein [Oscillospiraceae bacterium]
MKTLKTKDVIIIAVTAAIVGICGLVFLLSLIIPNKSTDGEFIKQASAIVSVDCKEYKSVLKNEKELSNLRRVKLWGYIGKVEFNSDTDEKYITNLTWSCKEKESFDILKDKLSEYYDETPSELDDDAGYKWKFYSFDSDDPKNLDYVELTNTNGTTTIRWETSNQAYIVEKNINELGEITLESKDTLDDINRMYKSLDKENIKYVDNYDLLETKYDEYYLLYVKYFDETAEKCSKEKSADNYDTAKELLDEYDNLDEKYQKMITKLDVAKAAKKNSKQAKHNAVIKYLKENCKYLADYNAYSIKSKIEDNMELLNENEICSYLPYAVCDKVLDYAEDALKQYLKDPSSYTRYDYGIRTYAYKNKGNIYYVSVSLKYGARNSFNALVTGSKTMYVYYKVANNKITFYNADLSAYDKWQLYSN